ncbi:MAG: hypothetical protein EON54_21095 [Alcaligenaceae bacterium]|nr:MAG: hypothetical protein EON54_21095 [Alcaligenaceae bacterium]
MHKHLINYLILMIALAMCGCSTTVHELAHNSPGPSPDEAVVVIGIDSPLYRVLVYPGVLAGKTFHMHYTRSAVFSGTAQNGYLVVKIPAGEMMAITTVVARDSPEGPGKPFLACDRSQTLVFQPPPGQVIYIADVSYQRNGEKLITSYTRHLEDARSYLRNHYPAIASGLKQHEARLLPTTQKCTLTIMLPIM